MNVRDRLQRKFSQLLCSDFCLCYWMTSERSNDTLKRTRNSAVVDKPRDAFVQMHSVADLWKTNPFPYVLPRPIWLLFLKSVVIDRGKTPKLGSAGVQPLWVGAWLAPKNKSPPHLRYRLKFGSSASNGLCINRREPPKLGSVAGGLAVRHGWPLEIRPSPRVILLNLVVLSQQVRALLNTGRSGWKIRPLAKIFPPPCI